MFRAASYPLQHCPWPGLAFVFWGFCAFALITLNYFATGVGLPFLSRASWFGKFYFYFAAAFAVAVAVSILGLFVRRFLVRPRRTPLSTG